MRTEFYQGAGVDAFPNDAGRLFVASREEVTFFRDNPKGKECVDCILLDASVGLLHPGEAVAEA